jgi:hypothetical protein
MPATVSRNVAPGRAYIFDVAGDASYATGGYPLSLSSLSNRTVYGINDGGAIIALWDAVNLKVKFITAATGAEVANASNQSAVTVKLLVV